MKVALIGTRDLDVPEKEFLKKQKMVIYTPSEIKGFLENTQLENVYVHVDLDVLNPDVYPAVKCPTPGGLQVQEIKDVIANTKKTKNIVGGSIVEYAPGEARQGLEIATDIYETLVG